MNTVLSSGNLAAWSVQIALVAAAGSFAASALKLRPPKAVLAWRQALLAACLLLPLLQPWRLIEAGPRAASSGISFSVEGPAPSAPGRRIPFAEIVWTAIAAGIGVRTLWLVAGCWKLRRIRRRGTPVDAPSEQIREIARRLGARARFYLSPELDGPVTFGLFRPAIVMPDRFLEMEPSRQTAVCAHELLHVSRFDWAFTLAEEAIRTLFWFHPAVWWLVSRIRLSREQVVDRAVVELTGARRPYLDALLEIAAGRDSAVFAPAPSFLRKRHLRERVAMIVKEMTMSKKRVVLAALATVACAMFAGAAAVRAFPLHAAVEAMPAVQITASPAPPLADAREQAEPRAVPVMAQGPYSVKEDGVTPPSLTYKIEPRYTGEAKNAGVQGAVVLDIVVGPDGVASDITVKKSLDAGLDGNAIEAVRQWRFKPGMKDGHPVAVRAAVEVNFRLSDKPKVEAGGLARPQLLSKVEPQYTEEARSAKIEGTVVLNVEVTPEGRAQNIRVVKGIDPGLDNKAMEAIQQWVFKPAMKDGQPVSFQATIEVNFRLQ